MITVTVKTHSYFQDRFDSELLLMIHPDSTITNVLKKLNIPLEEVGVLMIGKLHSIPLNTALRDGDIITIIPTLGGG